ncbi:MAG: FkbM family methyltransferase [Cellvibrionaceae bacterium]|jgi:FkbM family methyltransferase
MLTTLKKKLKQEFSNISNYRIINLKHLHKIWEKEQLKRLLKHYHVDCVFDIGANHGQYAMRLRNDISFKGLIISFEPNPEAAAKLKKNSEKDPLWIVEEIALSNNDGEQSFNIMSGSQFSSLSTPRTDETTLFKKSNKIEKSINVKTETLVSAYKRLKKAHVFNKPFLKLDTQGYDCEIVSSGSSIINKFIGLQSELAIKKIYDHSVEFKEAIKLYEDYGFSLNAFVPNNAGAFPFLIETDCIMVRNDILEHSH